MPPFEKPGMSHRRDKIWVRTAEAKDFAEPDYLWDHLWPRFNTMSIPVFDESTFWGDALSAAREAENRAQLDDLMARKLNERRKEFRNLLLSISYAIDREQDNIQSSAGRKLANRICKSGSLDNFLRFVAGVAFGWEDEADNEDERAKTADTSDNFNAPINENWDPNYIWTQPDSEPEYAWAPREGAYSLPSDDDCTAAIETSNKDRHLEPSNTASKNVRDGLTSGQAPSLSPPDKLRVCTAPPEVNNDTAPARTSKQGDGNARDVPASPYVGSGPTKHGSSQQVVCAMLGGTIERGEYGPASSAEPLKDLHAAKRLRPEDSDSDNGEGQPSGERTRRRKRRAANEHRDARGLSSPEAEKGAEGFDMI